MATVARRMGLKARIFVPSVPTEAKRALLRDLGAEVVVAGDVYVEARAAALADAASKGALMVHAFEAAETIIGQGTIVPELMAQAAPDALVLSVGGGGLAAGLASWFEERVPLICGEPELAPTLHAALAAGGPVDVDTGGIAADALGCRLRGQERSCLERQVNDAALRATYGKKRKIAWQSTGRTAFFCGNCHRQGFAFYRPL